MSFTAVYYIITLIIAAGVFLCYFKPSKRTAAVFLTVSALCMIVVSSVRYGIGFDYETYAEQYIKISETPFLTFVSESRFEIGFCLFMKLCSFISTSPVFFFCVASLVITALVAVFIYAQCDARFAGLAMYLYMTLGFFYGSMNLIRQYIALAVSLFAIKFISQRKPVKFFAVVIIASLFHISALILIPMYFLANIKLSKKMLIIYSITGLLAYIFSEPILKFVTEFVYSYYDIDSGVFMQSTGNIYVIIPAIVFAAAFLLRNRTDTILLNYSLYSLILHILMTKHFILERFAEYFSISYIVLLPAIAKIFFENMADAKGNAVQLKKTARLQKGGNQKQVKNYAESAAKYKDAKNFFILSLTVIMAVAFLYQILAEILNFHGVFPYVPFF